LAGAFLLGGGLTRLDEFGGSTKWAVGLVRLYAQTGICLTEQAIPLRDALEGPNEFIQQFQALRLGRLWRFLIRCPLLHKGTQGRLGGLIIASLLSGASPPGINLQNGHGFGFDDRLYHQFAG
jgi:hypothetical protein